MHRSFKISMLIIFVNIFSAMNSPLKADVEDLHCYLKATVDVRVEVWGEDTRGNKGQRIWKGMIEQGQRQLIKARFGRIRYASSVNVDKNEPLSGDSSRWCDAGATIGVP